MPSVILYLLKCQICLAIVWLFYQLLLRRLTFYMMNRWYLLGYACLSFLLPLIHIVLPEEGPVTGKGQVISYIPVIIGRQAVRVEASAFTGWDILLSVLSVGALLLTGRLLIRWLSLRRIRKEATLLRGAAVQDEAVRVYQVNKPIIPFSFGNAIYINAQMHTENEWAEIILHEYVHVRQRHTVDILLAELLCIVSWCNPFSWLIRHAIRQNLEFIADQQVLASGLDRKSYQYHLLRSIGEPAYRLANNFNFSSLKKRIVMMNRSKSARLHLVKFLFIVPLLGVLLVAFRDKVDVPISLRAAISPMADGRMDTIPGGVLGPVKMDTVPGGMLGPVKRDTVPAGSSNVILNSGAKPLIIVDEKESSMGKLKPVDIAEMNVLKDGAAAAFGAEGEKGVVLIYTNGYVKKGVVLLKNGKRIKLENKDGKAFKDTLRLEPMVEEGQPVSEAGQPGLEIHNGTMVSSVRKDTTKVDMVLRAGNNADQLRKCLFIVDGVETSYEQVHAIDPNRVASIEILSDKSGQALYGSRGKEGVILFTTKGPAFKGAMTLTAIQKEGDTLTLSADTIHFKLPAPVKTTSK